MLFLLVIQKAVSVHLSKKKMEGQTRISAYCTSSHMHTQTEYLWLRQKMSGLVWYVDLTPSVHFVNKK
jgi:hypothetical protein